MKIARPVLAAGMLLIALSVEAADWPQFRGPSRNNISDETGLLKVWPKDGPKLLWTNENAGLGYAGPAVVGNRVFILGTRGKNDKAKEAKDFKEYLIAIDVKTGKDAWLYDMGPAAAFGQWGDGSRSTPTVEGKVIYALSGMGELVCAETDKGKKKWSKNLVKDYKGKSGNAGYAESPLIDSDKIVVTPGGISGTILALNKLDGKDVWRSPGTETAAYSSIVTAEVAGTRQLIQMMPSGMLAVAAKDGRVLWRSDIGANPTAVIPSPVVQLEYVYGTSGYSSGCGLVKIVPDGEKFKPDKVYKTKDLINQHGGVVLVDDCIYGYSDNRGWLCQDFLTGKVHWEEKGKLGKGSITYADGMLYLFGEPDGTVVLLDPTKSGWKEEGRFKIPKDSKKRKPTNKIWAHPVVANNCLYLRDQELLFCFDIKATTAEAPKIPGLQRLGLFGE